MGFVANAIPSYAEERERLLRGERRCTQRASESIQTITDGASLNAFIELFHDFTEQARCADSLAEEQKARLPLFGMTVAVKDNIAMENRRTECASQILDHVYSPYDATAVARLRAAGALFAGRTNMDEFGMGSSTEYSIHGPTIHPHDPQQVAGGSSGGSAVAVATGMTDIALGSDTGGSVRVPAAFNGIVGFKPSYGRISRNGLVAFSSSCEQIGIMGRSVEDVTSVYTVLHGCDTMDASAAPEQDDEEQEKELCNIRIGLPVETMPEDLHGDMREAIQRAISAMSADGLFVTDVHIPEIHYALAANFCISNSETLANLARYTGVRYGAREMVADPATYRTEKFGGEVRKRLMAGALFAAHNDGALYRKALRVRRKIIAGFDRVFSEVDVLITPATAGAAFRLGEKNTAGKAMYQADIMNTPPNVTGIPAITIPAGINMEGMPVGVQLMSNRWNETLLLRVAAYLHSALETMDS